MDNNIQNVKLKKYELSRNSLYEPYFEKDNCGMGFIANIDNKKTNQVVKGGIRILAGLEHRGAEGYDSETGDGAGLLFEVPHKFFAEIVPNLPEFGDYGVANIFFPTVKEEFEKIKEIVEETVKNSKDEILTWREVPIKKDAVGVQAQSTMPSVWQLFIKRVNSSKEDFEKNLYILRRKIENAVKKANCDTEDKFYITKLSSKSIVYKGLVKPHQIENFYIDLQSDKLVSSYCLVHQRFSTNTFPSWKLAHPFRFLAHNGEINTVKGNVNWMKAREIALASPNYEDIKELFPINDEEWSDSANLDAVIELLVFSGKTLMEAISILVPAAWEKDHTKSEDLKAFYDYYSGLMEAWDGPAAMIMTDSRYLVAKLDRNGLRPLRYILTDDNQMLVGSEVGTLPIKPENIVQSGRVKPGKVFVIDLEEKKLYNDDEVNEKVLNGTDFKKLIKDKKNVNDLMKETNFDYNRNSDLDDIYNKLKLFSYSREDLHILISRMAITGQEPLGSMGNDAALAIFSEKPKLLYSYFKQLFAQVTNPPIDPIRENFVMSLRTQLYRKANILEKDSEAGKTLVLDSPIMDNKTMEFLKNYERDDKKPAILDITFKPTENLEERLDKIFKLAEDAIDSGVKSIILSDRNADTENVAIPALLAVAGLHHYLIRNKKRNEIDILVETGEAREIMHFALLIGYGATAINPYLALDSIEYMVKNKLYLNADESEIKDLQYNYLKAQKKSILKTMSKMGISTVDSYRGAQIFEAVGLSTELVKKYFTGTVSRIEGLTIKTLEDEVLNNFDDAIDSINLGAETLYVDGEYSWMKEGTNRILTPDAISKVQDAANRDDYNTYKEFAKIVNDQSQHLLTIRGMLKFHSDRKPVSIDKVEPVEAIMKRFVTGAMSFGSISKEAHEAIARALNTIGGRSNCGEGGENPERFLDNRRSATKQIASGRFGVTTDYLVNADELQIKMAQGAKPGEGGQLPGFKVNKEIGATRHTTPGISLISPPPHHDIYSIEDLAQLIFDLKNVNEKARISVKLVSEAGVGVVASGVAKAKSEMILISGHDGGTGASPLSSIKHAGLPWELGLSEAHQILKEHKLRSRVTLQVDGKLKTGRDLVIGAILGAEEFGFATMPLVILGCIMMRKCHTNMCPVGVATQSEELRKKFTGQYENIIRYFRFISQEAREIMAELGVTKLDELIGKADEFLEVSKTSKLEKVKNVDLGKILYTNKNSDSPNVKTQNQDFKMENIIDRKLIKLASATFESDKNNVAKTVINEKIENFDRSFGAMLSGEVARTFGGYKLEDDTITLNLEGIGGQSFGVFGAKGITYNLTGQSNDYIGKGLFGAKIIIKKPEVSKYEADENIIGGNAILYGAIRGEAYLNGVVGERFCVRNSGAVAVVEGVGDHGCEYMTGGRAIVLGETGKNFAAGMSGGIAYVYDKNNTFEKNLNKEMVDFDELNEVYENEIKTYVEKHFNYTGSVAAKEILNNWEAEKQNFKVVIAPEFKEIFERGEA